MRLLDMVPDLGRAWYAQTAVEHGWSRVILTHQIEAKLYRWQGQAQTNITGRYPPRSRISLGSCFRFSGGRRACVVL